MCRLYGLHASHPTTAACELLDAQNALIHQSLKDERGLSNSHGWGMGHVANGTMGCFRQVTPASESADYRKTVLGTQGTTILAHVRRATVGLTDHANTHPFWHGSALLIHNGHIPAFDRVRPRFLDRLSTERSGNVRGTTDSEHILALLLQLRDEAPDAPLQAITRKAVRLVQGWVQEVDPQASVHPAEVGHSVLAPDELVTPPNAEEGLGLNLIWTDGQTLAGSRFNRTLWMLRRDHAPTCTICDNKHAQPPSGADYWATVFASERITDEDWTAVPNGSVFTVDEEGAFHTEQLEQIHV